MFVIRVPDCTYWKRLDPFVIVNGLVNRKVGIGDLITEKVRTIGLGIVLLKKGVVLGHIFVLVRIRDLVELDHPLELDQRC